jgi:ribonuclease HI
VPLPEENLAEFQARLSELRRQLPPAAGAGPFVAWTDGACIGNPGPGGWAAFIQSDQSWDLWGHLAATTNNRAEALGVLAAIEWVPAGATLVLHSDSRITIGILDRSMKARANADLWLEINRVLAEKALALELEWVPGHAGVSGNERADYLSRLGASNGDVAAAVALGRPAPATPDVLVGLVAHDDWERNFLRSIANQLRSGRVLSARQQAIIDRIRARG